MLRLWLAMGVGVACLMASGVVRPVMMAGRLTQLVGDDIVVPGDGLQNGGGGIQNGPEPEVPNLPDATDGGAPIYPDHTSGARWYAPVFDVVQPQPAADLSTSPFLFSFRQSGVTGADPKPALEGTLRVTLAPRMSDATRAALAAAPDPPPRPVPTQGLTVSVEIPFKDRATGQVRTDTFDARDGFDERWTRNAWGIHDAIDDAGPLDEPNFG